MQALHAHIGKDGFRLRGVETSRVDAFSDVVFGFALTLIVVSLEVPRTFDELHKVLLGFASFAICFVFLISIWWDHFRFFRRYGMHDAGTIAINSALLFMVLFYVYPLKFLSTLITGQVVGKIGADVFSNIYQPRELMVVYGAGFAAIYFCLAGLYWNAWRQRLHLRLSALETTLTLTYLWDNFGMACIGLLCCLVTRLLPLEQAGQSGYVFFTIGIFKYFHGIIAGRRIRAAHARTTPEDRNALPHQL